MKTPELATVALDAALLLDFYGDLLPETTLRDLKLFYEEDFSLHEIAQQEGISRQAVHYRIQSGMKQLVAYEERLQQVTRWKCFHQQIRTALDHLTSGHIEEARMLLETMQKELDL